MNPLLVTLYGDSCSTSRAVLGGSRGQSVDLDSPDLGFDWADLVSKIGEGVSKVASSVGGSRAKREKQKQDAAAAEAQRLSVIASQKRKMLIYVAAGGGVILLAGGAFFLMRKREKRGNR